MTAAQQPAPREPGAGTYRGAVDVLDEIVHAVPPLTWEDPSYYPGWTIRDLIAHVVEVQWTVRRLATDDGGAPGSEPNVDEDPFLAWEHARAAAETALTPDAMRREVEVDGRRRELAQHLEHKGVELLLHAWELAHAADVGTTFDPGLALHALDIANADGLVGAGEYGPPYATRSSDPADQLAALLGRDVDAIADTTRTRSDD